MLPNSYTQNYPGIDILRALAAILVLVYHVIEYGNWTSMPATGLGYVLRRGWAGVDLFFTISGFVIALSALDSVQKQGRTFRRPFAIRRLTRIVPLYLLTGAVFMVLVKPTVLLADAGSFWAHLGSHILFIHNLTHWTHGSINGPSWSVALEMQFYLAMLLLAPWLARTAALPTLLYAIVLAVTWRFVTTLVLEPGTARPVLQFIYSTQLPGVIDEFALGIALALVIHRRSDPMASWLQAGWIRFFAWMMTGAALLGAAAWLDLTYSFWNYAGMVIFWRLLLASGFAALIGAAISFPWAASRVLAPIRYLGDISYGLYLWHMLVILSLTTAIPHLQGPKLLVVVLFCTFALASLTWHLLEKPNLRKYKGAHPIGTPERTQ